MTPTATRLDQTIEELTSMVNRSMDVPALKANDFPSPWLLDLFFLLPGGAKASRLPLSFDDVWIAVHASARAWHALGEAGFAVKSVVSRNVERAIQSVTAEFQNAFLELMWAVPTPFVFPSPRISPRAEPSVRPDASRLRALPIEFAKNVSSGSTVIQMPPIGVRASTLGSASRQHKPVSFPIAHPLGVRHVTEVRLHPSTAGKPVQPTEYLSTSGVVGIRTGAGWSAEITFDDRRKGVTRDFRPLLPIVVNY